MEQRLKLTPQMIQSIEILLLPQMALEERIMNEVESNPVLEMLDGGDGSDGETGGDARDDGDYVAERSSEGEPGSADGQVTDRFRDDDQDWLWKPRNRGANDDDRPDKMEALASAPDKPPSLAEHLVEQLRFQEMPDEIRELATE